MLSKIKVQWRQLKLKLRNYSFKCFGVKVNLEITKIPDSERIIWLLNKLLNEAEKQGLNLQGVCSDITYASIFWHKKSENGLHLTTSNEKVDIRGERDLTI